MYATTRKNIDWIEDLLEWCEGAPNRQAGSARQALKHACRLRGIPTDKQGTEELHEAIYKRYAELDISKLPKPSRSYKAPELHSSSELCGLGDRLLEELLKIHEAPNRRDKALLSNFRKGCEENQSEADLEVEKERLLSKIVDWELRLLDNLEEMAKNTLSTPKEKTPYMRTRSKVSLTPSPRKVVESDSEEEDSEEEDLEEESEHAVNGLLAVGFSSTDGTTMVQVLWADGSNTWEPLSTMQLQEDFQERLSALWKEAGVGKKNRVVITPPGEPIPCHTERGLWRENLPFSKVKSSKNNTYNSPPQDMANILGTLIFSISDLSNLDMPGWKLGAERTTTLTSGLVVGYRSLGEDDQGFELMQTMFPYSARYLSQEDFEEIPVVSTLRDCIESHQEDPTEVLFRLSNPEGKKVYSLEDSSSWPKLAVDKKLRSLLPNTIYEDEELLWVDPRVSRTQMLNEAASKSQTHVSLKKRKTMKTVEDLPSDRQPNVTVTQNHRKSPSEAPDPHPRVLEKLTQDLEKILPNDSYVIEQYRADIATEAAKIRTLAALVLNSNTNFSMSDKSNRSFPQMLGTDKSLEAVNPVTGTKDYTPKTTLSERVRDLDQVPARQTVVVGNPCGKICVGCEAKVFERYIKGLPTP